MAKNRIFFPQEALDAWLQEERVDLVRDELTVKSEGRRYRLMEAAHILSEVTGAGDPYELVGRVKSVGYLVELGAEVLDRSMIVGENAYEVVPGFLGAPVGSFAEHVAGTRRDARKNLPGEPAPPTNDEELLGQLLMRML